MSNSNKNIKQEMSRNSRHLNAEKIHRSHLMGYNSYEYLANRRKVATDAMCNNYMYRLPILYK